MRISSFCEFELLQLAERNLGAKAFTRILDAVSGIETQS